MVVGKTTQCLSELNEGDFIRDITGPLGKPTEIEGDSVAVIGGGVGLAIAYPVARMLCEQGKNVYVIMGARTKTSSSCTSSSMRCRSPACTSPPMMAPSARRAS